MARGGGAEVRNLQDVLLPLPLPGAPEVAAGRERAPQPTTSPRQKAKSQRVAESSKPHVSAAEAIEVEIKTVGRLKKQRAEVRRARTSLESLLLAEVREIARRLHRELGNAEAALTEKLNDAYARLRKAQQRARLEMAEVTP